MKILMCEKMCAILGWCNKNDGFLNAISGALALILSAIAIVVSVRTAKFQAQADLFEKRLEIYNFIQKVYDFFKRYPSVAKHSTYLKKCELARVFLYRLGSQEERICNEIIKTKRKAIAEKEPKRKEQLEQQWCKQADKLAPFVISQINEIDKIKSGLHLLYTAEVENHTKRLIEVYEDFMMGHVYLDEEELCETISKMEQIITEADQFHLIAKIEKQTLRRRH